MFLRNSKEASGEEQSKLQANGEVRGVRGGRVRQDFLCHEAFGFDSEGAEELLESSEHGKDRILRRF